jgi:hypothetical protein
MSNNLVAIWMTNTHKLKEKIFWNMPRHRSTQLRNLRLKVLYEFLMSPVCTFVLTILLSLCDWIKQTIFWASPKLWRYPLCNCLQTRITSSSLLCSSQPPVFTHPHSYICLCETKFCSNAVQQLALHTDHIFLIFLFTGSRQGNKIF